ncbi:LPS export ABC transporter permease LptF [Humitalea sp. 24SJ18S-53]|uniref:LPS export ABC transporter permease LptF n=1 Tax=Humitalea sp. 24SJ18S-53 TaxID=3422307 RepID=UPI003D6657C8
MSRVDLYIFRQLGISLVAVTLGLAALVWLTQSLRFIELVLDRGLSMLVFIQLTSLLLPNFFSVILPITTFVVALFTYVRLASDRELVVMRGTGMSDWRLARPAIAAATLSAVLCMFLQLWLVPISHTAFREWQFEIRNQLAAILLQEGVFSNIGNDLTVYARSRDQEGILRGLLIHDGRDAGAPVTILAEAGRITTTPQGPRVTLYNGIRQQIERTAPPPGSPPGTPQGYRLGSLTFAENSLDLSRQRANEEDRRRDSRERFIGELLNPDPAENLPPRDVTKFRAEAHQRLSNPLTALSFAMVGLAAALGGAFRRHGGGATIAIGVISVVTLLAIGLAIGNLAARDNLWIPLIWLHAIGPGVIAGWVISGAPGWPRPMPAPPESATDAASGLPA